MSKNNNGEKLFTDEELIWATQLAYCNFTEKEIKEKEKTVQEIVSARGPEIYYNYKANSTPSGDKKAFHMYSGVYIN